MRGGDRKKACKQSSFISFLLSKERAGRVLPCPVPKPVNLQSKAEVSKLCCTIKSPGVKERKSQYADCTQRNYSKMLWVRARHQSQFLKTQWIFLCVQVWESTGWNVSLETSTLHTNPPFVCITSVCKLKISTLKQTFRQNHWWLAHFYKIWFFYEKILK